MKKLQIHISNSSEAAHFVMECESAFNKQIDNALDRVFEKENIGIIALAGPTCSGKTTTAEKLKRRISAEGKNSVVMSIDDFFLDRGTKNRVDLEAPDYDSINAIDLPCLEKFVNGLNAGERVMIPKYSFTETRRVGYQEYIPDARDIYVFEGIQAVYPEVTSLFGDRYTSVFISVIDDVMFNGVYFESHEIRLLRRIVRDSLFRNTPIHKTLEYWDSVRTNEMENIFPNTKNPHVFIDSFLMYELFVTAPIVLGQLASPDMTKDIYPIVQGLKLRLEKISCDVPVEKHVPTQSVFREFIGR